MGPQLVLFQIRFHKGLRESQENTLGESLAFLLHNSFCFYFYFFPLFSLPLSHARRLGTKCSLAFSLTHSHSRPSIWAEEVGLGQNSKGSSCMALWKSKIKEQDKGDGGSIGSSCLPILTGIWFYTFFFSLRSDLLISSYAFLFVVGIWFWLSLWFWFGF